MPRYKNRLLSERIKVQITRLNQVRVGNPVREADQLLAEALAEMLAKYSEVIRRPAKNVRE